MIIDIVMPKMGESITEGTILEWKKQVGDTIALDEILLEIGTDKVDSEIPSSAEGVVVEILAKPNDVVIFLGAGSITKWSDTIVHQLNNSGIKNEKIF